MALVLVAAGCGATQVQTTGQLVFSGSGNIVQGTFSGSGTVSGAASLDNGAAPSSMGFTLSASGRVVTADLDAVATAWNGAPLATLTGSELSLRQVLTGSGVLSYASSPQSTLDLPFDYVVQSYTPSAAALLTLDFRASSNGASVTGILTATVTQ